MSKRERITGGMLSAAFPGRQWKYDPVSDAITWLDGDAPSDEQIAAALSDTAQAKSDAKRLVDSLERQHLAPRFLREYMLTDIAQRAAANSQDPMQLPAYVKLKALDDQIAALRRQL